MDNPETPINPAHLIAPLRYPGHLDYALDFLLSLIPDHQHYIEPFCGGAAVFFGKPKAERNWLNDIDSELVTTYAIIKDQPEELIAALRRERVSPERHEHFKRLTPKDHFETALRWFYLNRTSRLESMSKSWEFDDETDLKSADLGKGLAESSKKLQGTRLTYGDFGKVVATAPEGSFLFIAPPYSIHHPSSKNRLHRYPFEKEDHFRLAEALKARADKIKFLIAYNDDAEIRAIYSWDNMVTFPFPNKPPLKPEIAIMNYKR
jgi:DNA adenine methylase